MTTSTLNGMPRATGSQRKSLNQQLDRLDGILDGLSDGLQAAVVDAVKDAVGHAVQMALREVLTHPELVARLAATPIPVALPAPEPTAVPTARRVTWTNRLWAKVRSIATGLRNRWSDVAGETREVVKHTAVRVKVLVRFGWMLMRNNIRAVLLAVAVGVVAGAACYFAGAVVAAAVTGVVTAMLTGVARLLAPFAGLLLSSDAEA